MVCQLCSIDTSSKTKAMRHLSLLLVVLSSLLISCAPEVASISKPKKEKQKAKIQVALCLDTSNSMDGLIDQAKSQLWKMVNELATTQKDGEIPDIELALYEYGNSNLSATQGYVRQVSALTTDLDMISEKLFELQTNGGSEYCGWTIQEATDSLTWSDDKKDLKLIIIAGNEPFTQGRVDYKIACKAAVDKDIIINTIYCGNYDEGIRDYWENGATLGQGKYMNIDTDAKVVHIETPFDNEILELNRQLNDTYISYGKVGRSRKEMQQRQDANAASYGAANNVERAVSKAKPAYKNESWDLVDATQADDDVLESIPEENLPEAMKDMTKAEQKTFIEEKSEARKKLQAQISELNNKRQEYITQKQKEDAESLTLDNVMLKAIREQAEAKDFLKKE